MARKRPAHRGLAVSLAVSLAVPLAVPLAVSRLCRYRAHGQQLDGSASAGDAKRVARRDGRTWHATRPGGAGRGCWQSLAVSAYAGRRARKDWAHGGTGGGAGGDARKDGRSAGGLGRVAGEKGTGRLLPGRPPKGARSAGRAAAETAPERRLRARARQRPAGLSTRRLQPTTGTTGEQAEARAGFPRRR